MEKSRIRDKHPGSTTLVKILQFFGADPVSGMEKIQIGDPGWKKFGFGVGKFGSRINIPDPRH
jgi:hypothetical protein